MPYALNFTIPMLPDSQAAAAKGNWRGRRAVKKRWQQHVRAIVLGDHYVPEKPLQRATVRCERHSSVEPDRDNLASSFKNIIDGLVLVGVIEDDKPSVIGSPDFVWIKAKRGEGHVRIQVREIDDA